MTPAIVIVAIQQAPIETHAQMRASRTTALRMANASAM
jgi:hypothetical protein